MTIQIATNNEIFLNYEPTRLGIAKNTDTTIVYQMRLNGLSYDMGKKVRTSDPEFKAFVENILNN